MSATGLTPPRPLDGRPPGSAAAIGRSLRIYHGDVQHRDALDGLYGQFVAGGDLVFDIGAHVGDRVASFRRLGARVVAVEPQPAAMRALRLIHGRDPAVTLVAAAAGAQAGAITLLVNVANPTVSTAAQAFVSAARDAEGWEGQSWDHRITVSCTTLDALIAAHGIPAFIKIDVEGFEDSVLDGLTQPVPALSFEFTTIARDVASSCLKRLSALGDYRFALSLGETKALGSGAWTDAQHMDAMIRALPHAANSGDVYARLI